MNESDRMLMGENEEQSVTYDKVIQSTLWRAFDLIRTEVPASDFHVITALLHFLHEGVLDGLELVEDEWVKQMFAASALDLPQDDPSATVFRAFGPSLQKIPVPVFVRLLKLLYGLDPDQFREQYAQWIEASNDFAAQHEAKAFGEINTPPELARLLIGLADLPVKPSVYNPFGGLATFGLQLPEGSWYQGEDYNDNAAAIGLIRLLAVGTGSAIQYGVGDSIGNWNSGGALHDLIIANPPWNMRLTSPLPETDDVRNVDGFFLLRAIQDLKPKGKAIVVVPVSFLFSNRKDQRKVIERLLQEDLLETVIAFPAGVLKNTGLSFAVIIVNKAKQRPGEVRFVQADDFVEARGPRDKRINDKALQAAINQGGDDRVVRWATADEIRDHDLNLMPTRYFFAPEEVVEGGVRLGDHVTTARLDRFEPEAIAPFVRIRDLKEDAMDHQLQLDAIQLVEVPKHVKKLDRSALLLALRWNNLKPTWFEYTGTPIAVTTDILVLDVDQDAVDVDYLAHELLSTKVQTQVEWRRRGAVIPSLRRDDILDILIELPPKLEQLAKVKGLREAHVDALKKKAEQEAERHGIQLQQLGNTVSFKHRLGTPLLAVGSGIDTIRMCLDSLRPDWRDYVVSARAQLTLGGIMDNIAYELQRISEMLKADSLELDVTTYPLKPMDLVAYAKKAVHRIQGELNGGHEVNFFISGDIKEQLKGKAPILGNRELLDTAMNALVDNARRHGFAKEEGPHRLDIRVGLRVDEKQTWLVLSVANSGKAFPEGFGVDRYVRKNVHAGPTGHTGIGGYHVQEIIQYHKGYLELLTGPKLMGALATDIELNFPLAF